MSYKVDETSEIWKDIEGYEGIYQVSTCGRVRRILNNEWRGKPLSHPYRYLSIIDRGNGYCCVNLSKNNHSKSFLIHRLVAMSFIKNPLNLPMINHKDENPKNNNVANLEWCDGKYNSNYGTRNKKLSLKMTCHPKFSFSVKQYDLNNNLIKTYRSIGEASRQTGIAKALIRSVAYHTPLTHNNGKTFYYMNQAGGYKWTINTQRNEWKNKTRKGK